jgi:hypothetical protein
MKLLSFGLDEPVNRDRRRDVVREGRRTMDGGENDRDQKGRAGAV